jgi:hypothetical protein
MQSRILPSSAGSIMPRWTLNTHLETSMELVFQHWDGFCLLTENKQNKVINAINIHKFTSYKKIVLINQKVLPIGHGRIFEERTVLPYFQFKLDSARALRVDDCCDTGNFVKTGPICRPPVHLNFLLPKTMQWQTRYIVLEHLPQCVGIHGRIRHHPGVL